MARALKVIVIVENSPSWKSPSQLKVRSGPDELGIASIVRATLEPGMERSRNRRLEVVPQQTMRAKLIIAALLWLALPSLGLAEAPRPSYTTLVVEFVGEMDRPVPSVVISTSSQEGEWNRQHLVPELIRFLTHVHIVPASVLNEITELPLLKRALESTKPADDEPKTLDNVRFTAGVGHDDVQIMVGTQTSAKILKDIARVIA